MVRVGAGVEARVRVRPGFRVGNRVKIGGLSDGTHF